MDFMKSSDIAKHTAVLRVSNKPTTPPASNLMLDLISNRCYAR
jgi:hypothetical protein